MNKTIKYALSYGMSPANLARQYGWRSVKVVIKDLKRSNYVNINARF